MQNTLGSLKLPTDEEEGRSCAICGHLPVCTVFRAVGQLLEKFDEDDRPFEPVAMGSICTFWIHKAIVEAMSSDMGAQK